jgi:two-component system sensor histidine kinase QseC
MVLLFRKFKLPQSLLGRSLLASIGALLLVMVLLGAVLGAILTMQTAPFSWEGPENQEKHLEEAMRFDLTGRLLSIDLPAGARTVFDALTKDIAFQVLDRSGTEVFASPEGSALEALRKMPAQTAERVTYAQNGNITLQVFTSVVRQGDISYWLRNARSARLSLGMRAHGSGIFYFAAALTSMLAILVFSSIAWWTGRRAIQPLKEASDAAATIRPDNLTQRVDRRNLPSEVTPLVDAFNSALARLEQGYRVQQEFLALAAHELKTPLTLMRAEIELGTVANRELLLKDIDAMAIQVQQLLQLAEVSEIQNFQFEPLNFRTALEEALAYMTRAAEGRSVYLCLAGGDASGPSRADRGALMTLVKNLVENAIHHSPPGGFVTISLTSTFMSVCDEGPGVAAQDVPKLFTRFWRSDGRLYQGAGLGLSICRQIAAAHGWTLTYQDNASGDGADFRVNFGQK